MILHYCIPRKLVEDDWIQAYVEYAENQVSTIRLLWAGKVPYEPTTLLAVVRTSTGVYGSHTAAWIEWFSEEFESCIFSVSTPYSVRWLVLLFHFQIPTKIVNDTFSYLIHSFQLSSNRCWTLLVPLSLYLRLQYRFNRSSEFNSSFSLQVQ